MGNIAKQSAVLLTWFKNRACPAQSAYQLAGARQILQCVGKIKIGSSAQALYPPIFDGMENPMAQCPSYQVRQLPNRNLPERVGHRRARHDIPESLKGACN